MAQQPVIPIFGDWGAKDEEFTLVFQSARAVKAYQRANLANPPSFSSSSEQDGKDTSIEFAISSPDRKADAVLPLPSPMRSPVSDRAEKSSKRVTPINSPSICSSDQAGKASSVDLGNVSFDRKSVESSTSSSPRFTPFSNLRYNRKDHEYICNFPRSHNGGYRPNKNYVSAGLTHASAVSLSTDNSTISWDSLKEKGQQLSDTQASSDFPDSSVGAQLSEDLCESDADLKEKERSPLSPLHNQEHKDNRMHDASMPASARKVAGEAAAQGKFRGLLAGPGPYASPTALPKFGDWGASKPYTQIFGQHREEKLGGHPSQPSSSQAKMTVNVKPQGPQLKNWLGRLLCFHATAAE